MFYRIMADGLVLFHLFYIGFVVLGGLLIYKWRWLVLIHLPAVAWSALVELQNWYCPLTPLEQQFRLAGGEAGYSGGFVEHYIFPLIYPAGLTREIQIMLGVFVIAINLLIYSRLILRLIRK